MCLSVVGKIIKIDGSMAYADLLGVKEWVCIDLIEEPKVGEELLIHAGCAISKLTKEEAGEIKTVVNEFQKETRRYYG